MNILMIDFLGCYIDPDIKLTFEELGHKVRSVNYRHKIKNRYEEADSEAELAELIRDGDYSFVYSTNFMPLMAKVCHESDVPYISWSYDTPPNIESLDYMDFPTNKLFFFNRKDYDNYRKLGLETVYHMPLAVNTKRLSEKKPDVAKYGAEIALVGQLYYSALPEFREKLDDRSKGWIDGIIEAQDNLVGEYIVYDMLTRDVIDSMADAFPDPDASYSIKKRQLSFAISTYLTHRDRLALLKLMSERHKTALYTEDITEEHKRFLNNVILRKPVFYFDEMPIVMKSSKINLCPILRDNICGIPLRALDTMGSGGFLLSSYHPEMEEVFINGEELVMYSTIGEAVELSDYYLSHESEREKIAQNGFERMKREYKYTDRMAEMLKIAGF